MSSNNSVLSADSLARYVAIILPKQATPQLKTPYDAMALASHASMLAVGFRLNGLGEDHKIEVEPSDSANPHQLPSEWNAQSPNYAFRYAHSQSSMEYLLKINRMGSKAVIMGMGLGDDRTTSFDVKVEDYISGSSFPATPVSAEDAAAAGASPEQTTGKILNMFISSARLSDFGSLMRLNVIQKLVPSLQKEGYEETKSTAQGTSTSQQESRTPHRNDAETAMHDPFRQPYPVADPLVQAGRPGAPSPDFLPPGFEDPHDLTRPLRPMGGGQMGGFGNLGRQDLYPPGLGPNDPFRNIGPGLGGVGGGGMHPTFDDPLFQGQTGGEGGFNPQAPPGARFDPVGPHGGPARGGGGGFPGGRPSNPFGGFGDGDFL